MMRKSNPSNEVVQYATKINNAVNALKSSTKRIFHLLMEAHTTLSTGEYKQLRRAINVDKSSISKIENIIGNEVVMNNLAILPTSWGTLYELSQIDETWFQEFVDGVLGGTDDEIAQLAKITCAEAKELREISLQKNILDDADETGVSPDDGVNDATEIASSVRIKLRLKEGVFMDDEVRKQVEHFANQLSKDIFDIEIDYSSVSTNIVSMKVA